MVFLLDFFLLDFGLLVVFRWFWWWVKWLRIIGGYWVDEWRGGEILEEVKEREGD